MMKKGFNMPEMIGVVAIISWLCGIVYIAASNWIVKSKVSTTISDLENLRNAILLYRNDVGRWPPDGSRGITGLVLEECAGNPEGWYGAYMEKIPVKNPFNGYYQSGCTEYPYERVGYVFHENLAILPGGPNINAVIKTWNVPYEQILDIDEKIDGGDGGLAGVVRFTADCTDFVYIIWAR